MLYRIITDGMPDMTFDYTGKGWTDALITAAAFAQMDDQPPVRLQVVAPDGRIVKSLAISQE